jgi:hypothetical protein
MNECEREANENRRDSVRNFSFVFPFQQHKENEKLNPKLLGEFLGGKDQLNQDVLRAFVTRMNFGGMEFDEALRLFLQKFMLPMEAQQIDRFHSLILSLSLPPSLPHSLTHFVHSFSLNICLCFSHLLSNSLIRIHSQLIFPSHFIF